MLEAEGRVSAPHRSGGRAAVDYLNVKTFIFRYSTLYADLNFTEHPVTNKRK